MADGDGIFAKINAGWVDLVSAGVVAAMGWGVHATYPNLGTEQLAIATGALALALIAVHRAARFVWRRERARLDRANDPGASGDRLSIVVADLANDDGGAIKQRVLLSLQQDLGTSVEILPIRESIAPGMQGSVDERERVAQSAGQALLNRAHGDILIWGAKVLAENVVDLHFLVREVAPNLADTKSYRLNEVLRLPADFGADLGTALVAVVVTAAQPAFDDGNYVAGLLSPVVRRLTPLVGALPVALPTASKGQILHHFALACRIVGDQHGDNALLARAADAFRTALLCNTREVSPEDWANTQNSLGNALASLGERESSAVRLEEAVEAFRATLLEYTRARVPLQWATTQNNLGNALQALGARESGTERLEEAVAAYREALTEWRADNAPHYYGIALRNLARAEALLAERRAT